MTTLTTKPIVFVVDDDITVRESLKALIEASGWRGRDVRVGEGVSRSSATRGSELPGAGRVPARLQRSGSAEARRRRSARHAGHLHHRMRRRLHERQAMKAGAIEFLTKPFRNDVLMDAVRQALERSRRALEHDAYSEGASRELRVADGARA